MQKPNETELHSIDMNTGRIVTIVNALDVADLDPTAREPPVAQESYYLLYRVSEDSGTNWQFSMDPLFRLVDKQMKEDLSRERLDISHFTLIEDRAKQR